MARHRSEPPRDPIRSDVQFLRYVSEPQLRFAKTEPNCYQSQSYEPVIDWIEALADLGAWSGSQLGRHSHQHL